MSRRRRAERRELLPDPIYNSTLVEQFVNCMMWDGKKNTAQKLFYTSMQMLEARGGDEALKLFKRAVENCKTPAGSKNAPRWWRQLPGADRSAEQSPHLARHPLAVALLSWPFGKRDEREACQ